MVVWRRSRIMHQAWIKKPHRNPPNGPNNTPTPAPALAYTGSPINPKKRYTMRDLLANRMLVIDANRPTARVCPVNGTSGNGMVICALIAKITASSAANKLFFNWSLPMIATALQI